MRGFVYAKDADIIQRDASKVFLTTVEEYLEMNADLDLEELKQSVYEKSLRTIRRQTGKEPMIVPLIVALP